MGSQQSVAYTKDTDLFPGLFGSKQNNEIYQGYPMNQQFDYVPHFERCIDSLTQLPINDELTEPLSFQNMDSDIQNMDSDVQNMESDMEMKFIINSPNGQREVTYQIKNGEIIPVSTNDVPVAKGGAKKETGEWEESESLDLSDSSSSSSSSSTSEDEESEGGQGMKLDNSSIKTEDLDQMKEYLYGKRVIDDFPSDDVYDHIDRFEEKTKLFSDTDDSIMNMDTPDDLGSSTDKITKRKVNKNGKYA